MQLRKQGFKNYNLTHLTLLFLIMFTSAYFFTKKSLLMFYLPFSVLPMLTTLLFDDMEISFAATLALAVSIASISSRSFPLSIFYLLSGIASSILVKGARKRIEIIKAGIITGIIQAVSLIFIDGLWLALPIRYLLLLINGLASSIIVLGVLPIFEYLFKTITNVGLLELADTSHPLLQRMALEAPGTFHHSLTVGNLSENACNAVGANGLIARTGAYYHDIGKLTKAEYFSENQNIHENKHETLSPTMSKLVIMNHVKEGVDLAKKYKLNPMIIDFIKQHHGTSLVYYFYRRALENSEREEEVQEEIFRYPGPRPKTKETAIVLLADSTEAAVRVLKEPTPSKIREETHKIINDKFIDGQLNESNLALNDLEKISEVFIRILTSIYHSRISYPEPKNLPRS